MLCLQYTYTLPGTFPMVEIKNRIQNFGHKLDGFPGLFFKAYLFSEKGEIGKPIVNRYAPFYLWEQEKGIIEFIQTTGFNGLEESFGRPVMMQTLPISSYCSEHLKNATLATREQVAIPASLSIRETVEYENKKINSLKKDTNTVALVSSLDLQNWVVSRWRFYCTKPLYFQEEGSLITYQIGYIAQ